MPLEDDSSRHTLIGSLSILEVVSLINTSRPVSSFQLDITPEIYISQVVTQATLSTLIRYSETVGLKLFLHPSLSAPLSVCSQVL